MPTISTDFAEFGTRQICPSSHLVCNANYNFSAVYVGNAEPLSDQQLRNHFTKHGQVVKIERKQVESKFGPAKYGIAFVFFADADSANRALEETSPVVGYRTLVVGSTQASTSSSSGNAVADTSSTGNAGSDMLPKSKEDFRIFGTFDDHEGKLFLT